jgi:hypothetical protein
MLQLFNRVVHKDFDKEDRMNKKITLAVVATAVAGLMALVGAPLFSQSGAASQPTLQGVWRVTEITTTGPNASKNSSPQPSLYIYTAKHYSLIRINGKTARPDLPTDQVAKATAAQLLEVYGPVLSAQSGTYEAAGGKLTTRAIVAKGTGPMAPGVFAIASYKLDGTTLTITQERGFDGKPVENPTTWKLTRIE